ncbi:hypothetical protein FB45DRAFT_934417 [Roridomyces roridus]|uniref:Uncharacterized protein n=1 Tax=Roridomyces roridus TaxID=1738132 RepID=A0AAD7FG17_9AGAR|nr:hypothetical protein FB45DRAFT_934417 [Roridomyces roridus]
MSLINATSGEPRLPPELERMIFQLAAHSEPLSVPSLVLVAWRVRRWVQHLRYRVLLLAEDPNAPHGVRAYPHNDDSELSRLRSLPPSILRDSVRHLCVDLPGSQTVEFLLSTCSSVENLWVLSQKLPLISALPLKRLHSMLTVLFFPHPIDFTNVLFSRLTHLEIFDRHCHRRVEPRTWSGLKCLPHLTHLAFHDEELISIFVDLLRICTSLRVFVLISTIAPPPPSVPRELVEEPRFVWMVRTKSMRDWHAGAVSGVDHWTRAEDFVERRRSGFQEYALTEDASLLLPLP